MAKAISTEQEARRRLHGFAFRSNEDNKKQLENLLAKKDALTEVEKKMIEILQRAVK